MEIIEITIKSSMRVKAEQEKMKYIDCLYSSQFFVHIISEIIRKR